MEAIPRDPSYDKLWRNPENQCATLLQPEELRIVNHLWQKVDTENSSFVLFSAYYDPRPTFESSLPKVRILAGFKVGYQVFYFRKVFIAHP